VTVLIFVLNQKIGE